MLTGAFPALADRLLVDFVRLARRLMFKTIHDIALMIDLLRRSGA